ncbi:sterol desaturase family protein [Nitrincola sp. MINF-07-Sa-05]|uniref:sterol desaturase family protein n=1 Tax=Nitrincola salilacus TaxID=3400273 RepID=UPI0039183D32
MQMIAEWVIRLGAFLGIFAICAVVEWWRPKRTWRYARVRRWGINLGITLLNGLLARLTIGAVAVTAAIWAQQHQWGVLHQLPVPEPLLWLIGLLLLDLAIWLQHLATHHIPLLWRLHRMHHTDLELDVTTGLRFHPIEIGLSLLYKALIVLLFGIDPWVVIAFEVILNAFAIFTHANIRLPSALDRRLRILLVTPDMHRAHHSIHPDETNSNFGFFLSIWDKLFRTYTVQPRDGHLQMTIGLKEFRDEARLNFMDLIKIPLAPLSPLQPDISDESEARDG